MPRLTAKRCSGIKQGYWSPAKKEELCQRLGRYEDTGLEPEEIKARCQERTGEWLDDGGDGSAAVCSCCGECFDTTEADADYRKAFDLFGMCYRYCPSCGARMTGGDDNA